MKTWKQIVVAIGLASLLASPTVLAQGQPAPKSTPVTKSATKSAAKTETKAPKAKKAAKEVAKPVVAEPAPTPPPAPVHGIAKWEYQAFKLQPPKRAKWIKRWNDLGDEGWELVSTYENYYIFKRPLGK